MVARLGVKKVNVITSYTTALEAFQMYEIQYAISISQLMQSEGHYFFTAENTDES